MNNWVNITEVNLAKYQAGAFVDAYKTAALMDGQLDPLPDTILSVVKKIRLAIKNGGYSVDVDEEKIPASLENEAIVMIVSICKPRIAEELTNTERDALSNANALLFKIADKKYAVESPDNPQEAAQTIQSTSSVASVRPSERIKEKLNFKGLI